MRNQFFSSVFTRSDGEPPTKPAINGNCELIDVEVAEEQVKELIDGMRENSTPGPDAIPPVLLKMLQDEVAEPIMTIFRQSIDDGRIPDEWRDANITAIHKKVKPSPVITEGLV